MPVKKTLSQAGLLPRGIRNPVRFVSNKSLRLSGFLLGEARGVKSQPFLCVEAANKQLF